MNTIDVSHCKFEITSISRNFLGIPEFPRLLGKFPKSQVDSQIPKILGKFPSSGSAANKAKKPLFRTGLFLSRSLTLEYVTYSSFFRVLELAY